MEFKRLFALSGFTFASVLAVMPGTVQAASMTAAVQAIEARMAADYPQEKLSNRLERIMRNYKVEITFDYSTASQVSVPAQAKEDVVKDIAGSLASTGFAYRQNGAKLFSIYTKTAEAPVQQQAKRNGVLRGNVADKDGNPVVGATVRVTGTKMGTVTDPNGNFVIRNVPTGNLTVEVSCISYATMHIDNVKVRSGETKPLNVTLQEANEQLGEVVVTAHYDNANANALYARQKNMVAMSDGISADLMKKTSDNNMAQVLRRVSGVTIDNGRYVNVRGMGERYNNVELNGAALPSSEPNRRNFSFDVIPSTLVDNVTIAKTFTPDLPGEFTGGLVQVNTLAVPDKDFINLSLGTGMNTMSTGKDFLSNTRYRSDWFLGNMKDREWYAGRSEEEQKQAEKNATQKNAFGFRKFKAMPLQNYSVVAGKPFELGNDQKIGVVGALTYRNEQSIEKYKEWKPINQDSLSGPSQRYQMVTTIGALANVGWEMPNHKVVWRNMFNNRFQHTNMDRYVDEHNDMSTYEQYSTVLRSRLWQTQLEGEHHVKGFTLAWNASLNQIDRTNPDDRLAKGAVVDKEKNIINWVFGVNPNAMGINDGFLMYSNLKEKKKNIGFDVTRPFIISGNKQVVKAGYAGQFRTSNYVQQYIKPIQPTSGPELDAFIKLDDSHPGLVELYNPANFESGALSYKTTSLLGSNADFYDGDQKIHAAYAMGELTFFQKLHLTTGVRMEKSKTSVSTTFFDRNLQQTVDSLVTIDKTDFLPALTLVYNITDELNARFAYSRTLARPDFRELTPTEYYNVEDRVTVKSTGGLKQSYSDNFDVRIEWYPQVGEVVSLSAFYKKFKDPIEMVTYAQRSGNYTATFFPFNLDKANVKGLELNVRKSFGFATPALKDLYFNMNATLLKGDVTYNFDKLLATALGVPLQEEQKKGLQDRKRPLQGLAPYTVNAGLTYQGKIFGASLNYGRNDKRLTYAGTEDDEDLYEAPRNVLDFQLTARLLKERLEVKFNASDLLNEDILIYRNTDYRGDPKLDDMNYNSGDWVMSRIKKGVNLSVSVSYRL